MTQFIHRLDLMCLLFGRPVEVVAMIGTLGAPIESEDSLSATIRFESGAIVSGAATMTARRPSFRIDVVGAREASTTPGRSCWNTSARPQEGSAGSGEATGPTANPDS